MTLVFQKEDRIEWHDVPVVERGVGARAAVWTGNRVRVRIGITVGGGLAQLAPSLVMMILLLFFTNVRPASGGTPRSHRRWVCVFQNTTGEETVCCTFHFANTEGSVPPTDHTDRVACGSPPDHEGSDALCGQATLLARTRQTDLDGWGRRG